eukprot:2372288-Amphidinium_carterae.1
MQGSTCQTTIDLDNQNEIHLAIQCRHEPVPVPDACESWSYNVLHVSCAIGCTETVAWMQPFTHGCQ